MEITYNGKTYYFNKFQTLEDLLCKSDFLKLPLYIWKELLELKEGFVSVLTLQTILLRQIDYYDKSSNVNSFIYHGNSYWIDKNTRVGLVNLANSTSEPVSLFLDPEFIEIDPSVLKQYLANIECYASKCYVTTHKHLKNVKELKTEDELLDYDYKTGYPEKITLE